MNLKPILVLALLGICGYGLWRISNQAQPGLPAAPTLSTVPAPALESLRASQAKIAVATLRSQHRRNPKANLLCSPSGIHAVATALAMGAEGRALADLEKLIGKDAAASIAAYRPRERDIEDRKVLLGSTALFVDEPDLATTYAKDFETTFGSKPRWTSLNSGKTPDVDAWITESTNGRLKSYGPLEPILTGGLLVDAHYFHDSWVMRFDPAKTKDDWFVLSSGAKISTPTMTGDHIKMDFSEGKHFRSLSIPFRNHLRLIVLIPNEDVDTFMASSEFELSLVTTQRSKGTFVGPTEADVTIPKWRLAMEFSLKDLFKDLGLVHVYTQRSTEDFKKMFTNARSWPYAGKQRIAMEIDEEGAQAHVVTDTQVAAGGMSMMYKITQPFIFAVADPKGPIFFAGVVMDPRSKS